MATSENPTIQKLMDEVEHLKDDEENIEAKLQAIAEAVAAEQRKLRPQLAVSDAEMLVDPSDEFACEGCQ